MHANTPLSIKKRHQQARSAKSVKQKGRPAQKVCIMFSLSSLNLTEIMYIVERKGRPAKKVGVSFISFSFFLLNKKLTLSREIAKTVKDRSWLGTSTLHKNCLGSNFSTLMAYSLHSFAWFHSHA